MKKALILSLKVGLTGVLVYYVARQVWSNWDQVKQFDWQFDFLYLVLSLLCAMVALVVFSAAWVKIVSAFGHQLSQKSGFRILNLSNLGRYIPGKIWQVFGMLYYAKQKNIPEEQAAASFVMYELFTIPASLLVWVIAVQFEPALLIDLFKIMGPGSAYTAGILGLLGCAVLVLYPQPFLNLANYLLRKLGRPTATFTMDKSVALQAFVAYVLGWVLFGLAFWLFLKSVLGDSAPSVILSVGLYNIAYQIGYLAIFAPSGLGPRELIMGALLQPLVGPIGPALAVVARLWSIVIDVSAALMALGIKK
jgi:uncharacterized membrane protein YbhN (UPF0104 family)